MSPVRSDTLVFEDVAGGDTLPELDIPLTRTVIVATAIASRDYQDVHHDPGLAVERGSQDIFMNILSTNGFVGRFVTDWAGPGGRIESVAIRLGAPNYPGDTMVLTGRSRPTGPCRTRRRPGRGRGRGAGGQQPRQPRHRDGAAVAALAVAVTSMRPVS